MELPMNYHENINLNTDLLFTKKIRIFVLSSPEDRYTHFDTFYYEHKNIILIILQQIIQSQRFKKVYTILKRILKNIIKWLDISLPTDLTNYSTDHQKHRTNNTRIEERVGKSRSEDNQFLILQHRSRTDSMKYSYRKWYL